MKTQLKTNKNISPVENVKLFQACEINDNRKLYIKLWNTDGVKDEAVEIVDRVGGSVISKFRSKAYYMEVSRKKTSRFDVTSFKEKHPELYNAFLVEGESIELKTKIVK
jgi:hypothetical protein